MKNAKLSKKQAAKLAELEARDEFETEWAMQDLTNPEKVGLSKEHAKLVSDKLRKAYIQNEILAQVDEDDDDDVEFVDDADDVDDDVDFADEAEEPDKAVSVEDDVEFSEPDSEEQDEPKPLDETPPFMEKEPKIEGIGEVEETPAEELGMGDLEDELSEPGEEIAPSEDKLVPHDTDILPEPENEVTEEEVDLDQPQDEVILELPDGNKLSIKLLEDLATPMEENIMAAKDKTSVQERKASRRSLIEDMVRTSAEQKKPEDIKPSTEKKLGDDTSSQGSPFVMQDATRGVANSGLTTEKMTLKNSEGNSLLSDPNFTANEVPTVNPELLANNPDAYDVNKFSTEQSGLFTQKMEDTPDPLPTEGSKDNLCGPKGMQEGFELPSQLQSTQQRRTNVLASRDVECAACYNEDESPLTKVACEDCGNEYILCSHCIEEIDNNEAECPVCAAIKEANVREATGPNWKAYCKTPKDREEVCEDIRGDGDMNNDGGFRVKRTEDDDQCDGNYDLEVNASVEREQLIRENQELQLTLAKFAKAIETATVMAIGDAIEVAEIPDQVSEFMQDRSTNAAGLEHVRRTVAALARKNSQMKVSNVEEKMTRGASAPKINPAGFGFNPNPSQERQFNSHMSSLTESLQNIFTCPRKSEDEE